MSFIEVAHRVCTAAGEESRLSAPAQFKKSAPLKVPGVTYQNRKW
jgi:hypothetical protein